MSHTSLAHAELVCCKEFAVGSSGGATLFAGPLVGIGVQVVVVNVFGGELTVDHVAGFRGAVWNVEPAGFALVSVEHVAAIVPSEPSPHALGQVPNLIGRLLVQPVSHWALETIGVSENLLRELVLQIWENIIEWQGVGRHVDPAGLTGKNGQSLTWPQAVVLVPAGSVWSGQFCVSSHGFNVEFPLRVITRNIHLLLENRLPLGTGDALLEMLEGSSSIHMSKVKT